MAVVDCTRPAQDLKKEEEKIHEIGQGGQVEVVLPGVKRMSEGEYQILSMNYQIINKDFKLKKKPVFYN